MCVGWLAFLDRKMSTLLKERERESHKWNWLFALGERSLACLFAVSHFHLHSLVYTLVIIGSWHWPYDLLINDVIRTGREEVLHSIPLSSPFSF